LKKLRTEVQEMSEAELWSLGKGMRERIYPRPYDGKGRPTVSSFLIQLHEARADWRRRHPKL
jgi:hypothetical protein